jgi:hypothetical protein
MKNYMDLTERKSRCWSGYEPTPGKKPYSPNSCRKKSFKEWLSEKESFLEGEKPFDRHDHKRTI